MLLNRRQWLLSFSLTYYCLAKIDVSSLDAEQLLCHVYYIFQSPNVEHNISLPE